MTIRQRNQEMEQKILSSYATLSSQTKGRQRQEEECDLRTPFQRDRDRIIHCKSFRRLKHKTQVFLSPEGDHYRTRLTHTLEVSQIARTIANALLLNEDLTEAISLGHDLGHTPFGHAGERALQRIAPGGFHHNQQSVRVVEKLAGNGKGLNLTFEVRDGILCHTGARQAETPEGQVVRLADRIAYLNHDIEDAICAGVLSDADLPPEVVAVLGNTKSARISSLILSVVENSQDGVIQMDQKRKQAFDHLHKFMYDKVYYNPVAKGEEDKVPALIETLYEYFHHFDHLPVDMQRIAEEEGIDRAVTDYIAGMTDHFAVATFEDLFVPKSWKI